MKLFLLAILVMACFVAAVLNLALVKYFADQRINLTRKGMGN